MKAKEWLSTDLLQLINREWYVLGREQLQLGSLSHYINSRAVGYEPLPPFPENPPPGDVRDVEPIPAPLETKHVKSVSPYIVWILWSNDLNHLFRKRTRRICSRGIPMAVQLLLHRRTKAVRVQKVKALMKRMRKNGVGRVESKVQMKTGLFAACSTRFVA